MLTFLGDARAGVIGERVSKIHAEAIQSRSIRALVGVHAVPDPWGVLSAVATGKRRRRRARIFQRRVPREVRDHDTAQLHQDGEWPARRKHDV